MWQNIILLKLFNNMIVFLYTYMWTGNYNTCSGEDKLLSAEYREQHNIWNILLWKEIKYDII